MPEIDKLQIISCQHCQIYEDGEIVDGIGQPVFVNELLSIAVPMICPNCRALLDDNDLVFTNIDYEGYLVTGQVIQLAA